MMRNHPIGDLLMLVADRNTEYTMKGLFARPRSLGIRPITTKLFVHPNNDPGCRCNCDTFLRPWINQYSYAMVVFDREGCGHESDSREAIEEDVNIRLKRAGWEDRARAIVIDPELESWVWSPSQQIDITTGWAGRDPNLRSWLVDQGYIANAADKPSRPKEALEAALKQVVRPRSSSLFFQLASTVSFRHCQDPAFCTFLAILRDWFADEI